MRTVHVDEIRDQISQLCKAAAYHLPPDVIAKLREAAVTEKSPRATAILNQLVDNAAFASEREMPYCHDTGLTVVYAEVGQDVHLTGGSFIDAVHEGVRRGYQEGYLRNSIVGDPLVRQNTGDNTPAVVHTEIVPGEEIRLTVLPKGGGSENKSRMAFLLPGDGAEGIKKFVLETVDIAGGQACPPLVIGVGIGGSFDKVTALAKQAILREAGVHHPLPHIAKLEQELLELVNQTGIGPQGLGGTNTALWVAVETYGCHITALPVAVNLQCHAARKKVAVI